MASRQPLFAVGLTGGIASGKSTVREVLERAGATTIDADKLGHRCYEPGTECFKEVVALFGDSIVAEDGQINRKILGSIVFGSEEKMKQLSATTWPYIKRSIIEILDEHRKGSATVVVVEAAVLIEAEWEDIFDEVWVAYVKPEVAITRLMARNSLTEEDAAKRMAKQISNDERLAKATISIENGGSKDDLEKAVLSEWANLRQRLQVKSQLSKSNTATVSEDVDEVKTQLSRSNTAIVSEDGEGADDEESMWTKGKMILNLFLLLLLYVWWDFFGVWLVPCYLYVFLLIIPMPFGQWTLETRMQVRSVIIIYVSIVTFPLLSLWILLKWNWVIVTLFCVYVACFTLLDDAPKCGKRFIPTLRRRRFWRHFASYFPIQLTRTAELDPTRNYLFGYHPHGIISIGALCNFATNATGFDELFPGIDLRLLTLAMNFRVPFFRELLLGLGINDASPDSLRRNLTRGSGSSVMLVIGGARESLATQPGHLDVVLKERKGFVKWALKTGASLVPVMSFGENDVFGIYSNPKMLKFQLKMQKKLGFAVPMFFGKALAGGLLHRVFGVDVGVMPLRVPIHSVVGSPIHVEKAEKPTPEQIDEVHKKYMAELERITKEFKDQYEKERQQVLENIPAQRRETMKMQMNKFNIGDYHVEDLSMEVH